MSIYIRGFICPKYDNEQLTVPSVVPDFPSSVWIDEAAKEVIGGKWGNAPDRKENLYNAIQSRVNELTRYPQKSMDELAHEVIAGKWGNGQDRKNRLATEGYNYDAIQARVNALKK